MGAGLLVSPLVVVVVVVVVVVAVVVAVRRGKRAKCAVDDGGKVGGAGQGLPARLLVEDLLGAGDVEVLGGGGGELAYVGGVVEYQAGGVLVRGTGSGGIKG